MENINVFAPSAQEKIKNRLAPIHWPLMPGCKYLIFIEVRKQPFKSFPKHFGRKRLRLCRKQSYYRFRLPVFTCKLLSCYQDGVFVL